MDEIQLNTLYVLTEGAYLHRDGQTVSIELNGTVAKRIPIHLLDSIACFGRVMVSPQLMEFCAEERIAVNFLTAQGRMMARVDAPGSGNVLLRRAQFRKADDPEFRLSLARAIVAGKIQNARQNLLRSARDIPGTNDDADASAVASTPDQAATLHRAAELVKSNIEALPHADNLDTVRGHEGDAARVYFAHFALMTPAAPESLRFVQRTRRPPLDPVNALLSLFYSILTHDCTAALVAAGLDPSVGFFHEDRPGRPSLALDLVEEFRAPLVDRFVITLINRRQVGPEDFLTRPGGAVELTDTVRKRLVTAFQERKQSCRLHPYLEQEAPLGRFPLLQARILARHIRGELEHYVPLVFK